MTSSIEQAAEAAIQAARDASRFFENFDKTDQKVDLQHAAAYRPYDWLLGDYEALELASLPAEVAHGLIDNLQPPDEHGRYLIAFPHAGNKPFRLQELHQIVRELTIGIYVFNQTPSVQLSPNYDQSTSVVLPSAYTNTLVGQVLISVDYYMKCLLHGAMVPIDHVGIFNERWRKLAATDVQGINDAFKEAGYTKMSSDPELGEDIYVQPKKPFIRHPAYGVDVKLAEEELTPRLTSEEEYTVQERHIQRDIFLRYLESVGVSLIVENKSIQQDGHLFVMDSEVDVYTSVLPKEDINRDLLQRLHAYLQLQRDFIREKLELKSSIAYNLKLLKFVGFMVTLLVTLKKHHKVIDVEKLMVPMNIDRLHTERELPPVIPTQDSRWSPFISEESYTHYHGAIVFQKERRVATLPSDSLCNYKEIMMENAVNNCNEDDFPFSHVEINDQKYYTLYLVTEDYYPKSPKLPRWIHAMYAELKTQATRLPGVSDAKVQDFLRKVYGAKRAARMKVPHIALQACIERDLLIPALALVKRCTQTRLNKTDDNGLACIHHAAINGNADMLELLVTSGCQQDLECCRRTTSSLTPLHLAVQSGSLDTVGCLLMLNSQLHCFDSNGWHPVHHAAHSNCQHVVGYLIRRDPFCLELQTKETASETPLLLACHCGGLDTIKTLMNLGANFGATNSAAEGIVHIAISHNHINILQFLLEADITGVDVWKTIVEMLEADAGSGKPEAAARVLDPLSKWIPEMTCKMMLEYGGLYPLARLLQEDTHLQALATQALKNISHYDSIKTALVVDTSTIIPDLVRLLSSTEDRILSRSCSILCDLGLLEDCQSSIVSQGAIEPLVKLIHVGNRDDIQLYACALLGILARRHQLNQSAVSESSGVEAIIALLKSELACIQACASNTLCILMTSHEENQLKALSNSAENDLVNLLKSKVITVHCNAALAIEAMADGNPQCQTTLLSHPLCITLLIRLLKMVDREVKICGTSALWAIAGHSLGSKCHIAYRMGLEVLVDMVGLHCEELEYICSEALYSLASEVGDNQAKIADVGGILPLVDILRAPSSDRVCLSVIHTLAALTIKTALVPNVAIQTSIAASGITLLTSLLVSHNNELVRVEAACTLAKLVLNHKQNERKLMREPKFSYLVVLKFYSSENENVRLLAGHALAIFAFNNPERLDVMIAHGSLNYQHLFYFIHSKDEFHQTHAAFQAVVLAKMICGIKDVNACIQGIRILIHLLNSKREEIQILSSEFLASLARSKSGVPEAIVLAGAMDSLVANLLCGNKQVIEAAAVVLGYLSFNAMAFRILKTTFRDNPQLFTIFYKHLQTGVVSAKFLESWRLAKEVGLPALW